MKNKFISLFIILTMVISSITFVSAEETALTAKQQEAYEVLSVLGYIEEGYDEESLLSAVEVSRAEFAELIYKVFGNGIASDTAYFYDVPSSHFAARAISSLVEMRLISVGEDRMFNPDRAITRDEAAKIICYALGYSALSEAMGGWTKGINAVSNDLELFEGVSTQKITYIDMLTLIYNALFAEVLEIRGAEGSNVRYDTTGETYLSQNKNIYVNEGVVAGYDEISIFGDTVMEGKALIGKLVLDANGIDLTPYLGMNVKYLYEYDDNNDESTLVWVKEHRKSEVLELNKFDNTFEFDPSTFVLHYYMDNRSKKEQLNTNINVVYNGGYVTTGIADILSRDFYSIRLVSGSGDDYEIAIIDDYENYILSTAETSGEVIYVQSCTGSRVGTSIDLSEYERVVMFDAAGNQITLDDIPAGSVISVKKTVNKERITIILSTKTVSGKVSSINTNYDDYKVYDIDGNEYMLYDKNVSLNVPISSNITFMLDAYGYIAKGTLGAGAVQFGYLLKAYCDDSGFDDSLIFKIINSKGEVVKYNAAKTIYIDAVRYKEKPVQAFDSIGGKNWSPQIVAYYVNANDEINQIDTPENEATAFKTDKNMFTIVESGSSWQYNAGTMNFGPKVRVDNETLIFSIPDCLGSDEEESVSVVGPSAMYTWETTPNLTSYAYGLEDWEVVDVIVTTKSYFADKLTTRYLLVDKVKHILNDDEEVVCVVEGYANNGITPVTLEFSSTLDDRVKQLERGDYILVTSAVGKVVTNFEVKVDVSNNTYPIDMGYITDGTKITSFYVNNIIGGSMRIGYYNGSDFDATIPVPTSTIYVYDSHNNHIEVGSTKDFVSYEVAGNNCSRVLQRITNNNNGEIIIYK